MNKSDSALHNLVVTMPYRFRRLLVANRSEIAIRVFRAATELGIQTVAVYAEEDKLSLHRFKADEAYQIGKGRGPLEAYLSIDEIIRVAKEAKADAIHPGYGFLSENPGFRRGLRRRRHHLHRPAPEDHAHARRQGRGAQPRRLGRRAGDAGERAAARRCRGRSRRIAARDRLPADAQGLWGGGGRGMRPIASEDELLDAVVTARREAKAAFGKDEVYLEKLVGAPAMSRCRSSPTPHGNIVHLFERDCTVQRRHQKVDRARARALSRRRRRAEPSATPRSKIAHATQLCRRRHGRVPDGCRHRRLLLHRGQSAHPGRAHGHRGGDRHRHRQGADPHRRGRPHRPARGDRAFPRRSDIRAQRPRAPVPDHHRGSREQLHPRLRPHHRLSRRHRLRHPPRRRHRLFRRGGHPLLRPAAREGHRLGADAGGGHRAA